MGKVHGSLARAGKVRAQTPKVAPAEGKKKKKQGRAKKRLLYNKRYAALTTGKKVKPNSQILQAQNKKFREDQALRIKASKESKNKSN